jgi:hypothetical protein
MKRDSGMKDRDERSRGMEIHIPESIVVYYEEIKTNYSVYFRE